MQRIEWNDSFSLGVQPFDEHHRHLLDLINKVFTDYSRGEPAKSITVVLDRLINYAIYHFSAEEYLMDVYAYPGYRHHKTEHDMFADRVVQFKHQFSSDPTSLHMELITFLSNWFTEHIFKSDADYANYFLTLRSFPPNIKSSSIRLCSHTEC